MISKERAGGFDVNRSALWIFKAIQLLAFHSKTWYNTGEIGSSLLKMKNRNAHSRDSRCGFLCLQRKCDGVRKLIAVAIAALYLLGLTACGSGHLAGKCFTGR